MLIPEKDAQLHLCPLRQRECAGPRCAAWRGGALIKVPETLSGAPVVDENGKQRISVVPAGYCGLAGVPPEVSSSQALQLLAEIPGLIAMISSVDKPGHFDA